MRSTVHRRNGFTIVEILVVIGIIGVLAGLILPALGGAQRRASKSQEINRIRQVGVAWNLYANSNRDGALPGFLESGDGVETNNVQGSFGWKVRYKLPTALQDADDKGFVYPDEAEEWSWRLMPYLDFDHEAILGYMHKTDITPMRMSDYDTIDLDDPFELKSRPIEISLFPAFGYNAFHVGGWWEMQQPDLGLLIPRPRFACASSLPTNGDPQERIKVISTSPSTIRNSSRLILFCSSSIIDPGEHYRTLDERLGAHFIAPPTYADTKMWGRSSLTPSESVIEIQSNTPFPVAAPIGRYTEQAAVLHADLHTAPQSPGALDDQRFWIDAADRRDFKHTPDTNCPDG